MSATPASAVALPTRSELEAWSTTDLADAAANWRTAAIESESAFDQHRQNIASPGGTTWEGDAKDAALDRVTNDIGVVGSHGAVLREAAGIAENGAGDIEAAKRDVLAAIQETEDDGFRVGEDLSVTDTRKVDLTNAQARYAAAAEHAEDIRWSAERLVQADALVGERLKTKAGELEGIRFEGEDGPSGHVQLVSNEFKQSPYMTPGTPDDPGGSGREPHPDFPGRDVKGRYLPNNSGALDGAIAAERRIAEEEVNTGKTFDRQQIRVAIIDPATGKPIVDEKTGKPLYRFYDALEPTGTPGRYIGIEVKSGESQPTRTQKIFDSTVNSGKPATGTLNGQPIQIIGARELRAPLYMPDTPSASPGEGPGGAARGGAGTTAVAPAVPVEPKAPVPSARVGSPPLGLPPLGGAPEPMGPMPVHPPGHMAGDPDLPVMGDGVPDEYPR